MTTKWSTSSPSAVKLADGQSRTIDVGHGERVDLGNVLVGELLPGGGVVLLLGVVKVLAARAGDDVDHALGRGVASGRRTTCRASTCRRHVDSSASFPSVAPDRRSVIAR